MVACRRMRLRRRDSGFRRNGRWETASIKRIPIPAKAGISRGGIVRHASPTGDIGFRFAEFPADAGRDSRFRGNGKGSGNGRWGAASIKIISIPAKAGISLSSNCFGARCQKTVRDSGRFPFSREWECFFLRKKKINPRRPLPVMRLEFRRRYFRRPVWGRARF